MSQPTVEIRVEWSGAQMALIVDLIGGALDTPAPETIERMVLRWWWDKHYARIHNGRPPYTFRLKDYQALALQNVLLNIGLDDLFSDALRNGVIAELDQQLPHNSLKQIYATWPAQLASPNFLTEGS